MFISALIKEKKYKEIKNMLRVDSLINDVKNKAIKSINYLILEHISNKVSGKIVINFFEGGITSWKIEKTFKPEK